MFKLAKMREMKSRDLDHTRCIKSDNQKVLVKDNAIKNEKEYFNKFLNEDSIGDLGTREDNSLIAHTSYRKR